MNIQTKEDEFVHERVELPGDVGQRWSQACQVCLAEVDASEEPYKSRFESCGQEFVVIVPVLLHDDLKGVLLLGFASQFDISRGRLRRVADLAGRFAVALSSVEREEVLYKQAHFDDLTGPVLAPLQT